MDFPIFSSIQPAIDLELHDTVLLIKYLVLEAYNTIELVLFDDTFVFKLFHGKFKLFFGFLPNQAAFGSLEFCNLRMANHT